MLTWFEQPEVTIHRHANVPVGFQRKEAFESEVLVTSSCSCRHVVDAMHERLASIATSDPRENPRDRNNNSFARGPDGRTIESQHFLHWLPEWG
ncbi:MAG: VOC family protein [Spirochaetaceae bacterium]|nr:MAG: VOC family protein [Spirochaetaceae bacterium]